MVKNVRSFLLAAITLSAVSASAQPVFNFPHHLEHYYGKHIMFRDNVDVSQTAESSKTPILLNDRPIYRASEVDEVAMGDYNAGLGSFEEYVLYSLKPYFRTLADGVYVLDITNVVTDPQGRVAYHQLIGLNRLNGDNTKTRLTKDEQCLNNELKELFAQMKSMHPAWRDGKAVFSIMETYFSSLAIHVADGRVTIDNEEYRALIERRLSYENRLYK